jgi:surfeit locus 1 family protein
MGAPAEGGRRPRFRTCLRPIDFPCAPSLPPPAQPDLVKVTPRGLAAAVVVLLVAALCVRLGFWQLSRLEERRARNEAIRAAAELPPLRLDAAGFDSAAADPGAQVWRRAEAVGRFLPGGAQVLRGRSRAGHPGVWVAAPLRTAAGTVMVLRGWAPSADGARVERDALAAPGGEVRVAGALLPLPERADRGLPVPSAGGDTTWRSLELAVAGERAPGPVLPLYLQLLPDAGAAAGAYPHPEPLPELSEGSHLGYALQWFSFALIALGGFAVVVLRGRR